MSDPVFDPGSPYATIQGDNDGRAFLQDGNYFRSDYSLWSAVDQPEDEFWVLGRRMNGNGPLELVKSTLLAGAPGGGVTLPIALAPNDVLTTDAAGNDFLSADSDDVPVIQVPMSPPTGVAATPGTAGTLAAGTYYFKVVQGDGTGWSLPSAEVSAVISVPNDGAGSVDILFDPANVMDTPFLKWRIYVGTTPGGEDRYFDYVEYNATSNWTVTTLTGATLGTPPTSTTALWTLIDKTKATFTRTLNAPEIRLKDYSFDNQFDGGLIGGGSTVQANDFFVLTRGYYYGAGVTMASIGEASVNETPMLNQALFTGTGNVPAGTPFFWNVCQGNGSVGHLADPVPNMLLWLMEYDFKSTQGSSLCGYGIWELHGVQDGTGFLDQVIGNGLNTLAAPTAIHHVRNPTTLSDDAPKNYVVQKINGRADQVANLTEWFLEGGSVLASVDKDGAIAINNAVSASVATPSTHKVAINIGGSTYYLLASNV